MRKEKRVLSKRLFYTLMFVFILVFAGVSVYALSAGSTENPGHNIQSIGAPSDCAAGEFLKWYWNSGGSDGVNVYPAGWEWKCGNPTVYAGTNLPTCPEGNVYKTYSPTTGAIAWACQSDKDINKIGLYNIEIISSQSTDIATFYSVSCPTGKYALGGACYMGDGYNDDGWHDTSGHVLRKSSIEGTYGWYCQFDRQGVIYAWVTCASKD